MELGGFHNWMDTIALRSRVKSCLPSRDAKNYENHKGKHEMILFFIFNHFLSCYQKRNSIERWRQNFIFFSFLSMPNST